MTEDEQTYTVRCDVCSKPFEQRENLLTGEMLWFPTCRHGAAHGKVSVDA